MCSADSPGWLFEPQLAALATDQPKSIPPKAKAKAKGQKRPRPKEAEEEEDNEEEDDGEDPPEEEAGSKKRVSEFDALKKALGESRTN